MKTLITGATGFVGHRLCHTLLASGHNVVAAVRQTSDRLPPEIEQVEVGSLTANTDWSLALQDVQTVVHCAARAHVMNETSDDPLSLYLETNYDATMALARQAARSSVKRLIFISSIKVHGEHTEPGAPWHASSPRVAKDPYGLSKALAEQGLEALAQETGLEVTIIRPPLVYGPGVKANFASLLRWVQAGRPMPLGSIRHNRRSMVALDNLVDLIQTCVSHPNAANQAFLVSDGEDLSTADLVKRMGKAIGRPARLLPVPPMLFKLMARLLNKPGIYQRLCGSLQLDISHTTQTLDWTPAITVDEGLRRCVVAEPKTQS